MRADASGISVPTSWVRDAALTPSTADDLAILRTAAAGADTVYGSDYPDVLDGFNGNDTIYGNAGNDTAYGEAGNDYLNGGAGSDRVAAINCPALSPTRESDEFNEIVEGARIESYGIMVQTPQSV